MATIYKITQEYLDQIRQRIEDQDRKCREAEKEKTEKFLLDQYRKSLMRGMSE